MTSLRVMWASWDLDSTTLPGYPGTLVAATPGSPPPLVRSVVFRIPRNPSIPGMLDVVRWRHGQVADERGPDQPRRGRRAEDARHDRGHQGGPHADATR